MMVMSSVPPSIPDGGEQLTGNKVRPPHGNKRHTTIGPRQHTTQPNTHNTTQHTHSNTHDTIKHREISPNHSGPSVPRFGALVTSLYAESRLRSSGTEFGSVLNKSSSSSLPGRCFLSHRVVTSITHRLFSVSLFTPVKNSLV